MKHCLEMTNSSSGDAGDRKKFQEMLDKGKSEADTKALYSTYIVCYSTVRRGISYYYCPYFSSGTWRNPACGTGTVVYPRSPLGWLVLTNHHVIMCNEEAKEAEVSTTEVGRKREPSMAQTLPTVLY